MLALARRLAAFGGGAERLEADIVDARLTETGRQYVLRKSGPARERHSPDIDHPLDARRLQRDDELGLPRAFISDREQPHHAIIGDRPHMR